MSTIAALTEDYAGAAAGVTISPANSIYDTITGTATSNAFNASGPSGGNGKSQRIACGGGNSINNADLTPVSALYVSFYFYLEATPSVNQSIMNWFSGVTKVGDLRILTDNTIQLRDNINSRWISSVPLALGEWHRVEVKMDPGEPLGHLANVWSGGNLHGTTTPSQTSGGVPATAAGLLPSDTVSQIRLGGIANDTTSIVRFSRLRGDNAAFPTPLSTGNIAPVANAGPDQTTVAAGATVTLTGSGSSDADGTIASYAWVQLTGPTVVLAGSGANRTFTAPAIIAATMTFQLTVTDNLGTTGTDTVLISTIAANTAIPELTEDYAGAAAGVTVGIGNSIFDNITGTATVSVFHASGPVGGNTKSHRIVAGGGNNINNADITPVPTLFFSFYLYLEAVPTLNEAILSWWSGAVKVGDLRVLPDATIQLRDNATGRWTSTPLALGAWHRIELMVDPGEAAGHLVNVWSGSKLNETTTPSQTSGLQTATLAGVVSGSTVSQIRLGLIGNDTTAIIRFSRLRGDSTVIPAPIASTNVAPTANAGADQTGVAGLATVTLNGAASSDPDGSIASYEWAQVAGFPVVTLAGTGANRTFTAPAVGASTTLSFQLTVTDDAGLTATDTVTVQINASTVVANAGADQIGVVPFAVVSLTAAGVGATSFVWTQTGSPTVTLLGSGGNQTFIAPATILGTTLTFLLTGTGAGGITGTDTMTVQVLNHNRFKVDSNGTTRVPIQHKRVS